MTRDSVRRTSDLVQVLFWEVGNSSKMFAYFRRMTD